MSQFGRGDRIISQLAVGSWSPHQDIAEELRRERTDDYGGLGHAKLARRSYVRDGDLRRRATQLLAYRSTIRTWHGWPSQRAVDGDVSRPRRCHSNEWDGPCNRRILLPTARRVASCADVFGVVIRRKRVWHLAKRFRNQIRKRSRIR